MHKLWQYLIAAYHRMPPHHQHRLDRLYHRVPFGRRVHLENLCWWAIPDLYPSREQSRVFAHEVPDWVRIYKIEPGRYMLRAKFMGPEDSYRGLSVLALMLAFVIIVFALTGSRLVALIVLLLTVPTWPLMWDAAFSKVEVVIDREGNIAERTVDGTIMLLTKFNDAYAWRAMPHNQAATAGNRGQLVTMVWQGFQRIVSGLAAVSKRPNGTLLTAIGGGGAGGGPYQMASELFIVRGAGGSLMVKVAEFIDDPQLFKARAFQAAIERTIHEVRKDLSDLGIRKTLHSSQPGERYE